MVTAQQLLAVAENLRMVESQIAPKVQEISKVLSNLGLCAIQVADAWESQESRRMVQGVSALPVPGKEISKALNTTAAAIGNLQRSAAQYGNALRLLEQKVSSIQTDQSRISLDLAMAAESDEFERLNRAQDEAHEALERSARDIAQVEVEWNQICVTTTAKFESLVNALEAIARSPTTVPESWSLIESGIKRANQWWFEETSLLSRTGHGLSAFEQLSEVAVPYLKELRKVTQRRGHWRRTPSGGRTWVRPHQVKIVDRAASRRATYWGRTAKYAGRAAVVAELGAAAWDEYSKVRHDTSLATSEKVGLVASATVFKGGAAVAGAKAGVALGTFLFPGPGSVIGGIAGAIIGSLAGSLVGGGLHSLVRDEFARVSKSVSQLVSKVKFW